MGFQQTFFGATPTSSLSEGFQSGAGKVFPGGLNSADVAAVPADVVTAAMSALSNLEPNTNSSLLVSDGFEAKELRGKPVDVILNEVSDDTVAQAEEALRRLS